MQIAAITVGTSAVQVPVTALPLSKGLRLLARSANSGNVYVGTSPAVTTSTGNLLPKGDWATSTPYLVAPEHFGFNKSDTPGTVWLIADGASQVVDWSSQ